jgi:hypothetical protein
LNRYAESEPLRVTFYITTAAPIAAVMRPGALAMEEHRYNDPNLSAIDFLIAVRRDKTVDIYRRIEAANVLMRLDLPQFRKPCSQSKVKGDLTRKDTLRVIAQK